MRRSEQATTPASRGDHGPVENADAMSSCSGVLRLSGQSELSEEPPEVLLEVDGAGEAAAVSLPVLFFSVAVPDPEEPESDPLDPLDADEPDPDPDPDPDPE